MSIINMVGGGAQSALTFPDRAQVTIRNDYDAGYIGRLNGPRTASGNNMNGNVVTPAGTFYVGTTELRVYRRDMTGVVSYDAYPNTYSMASMLFKSEVGDEIWAVGGANAEGYSGVIVRFDGDMNLISQEPMETPAIEVNDMDIYLINSNPYIHVNSEYLVPYTLDEGVWHAGVAASYTQERAMLGCFKGETYVANSTSNTTAGSSVYRLTSSGSTSVGYAKTYLDDSLKSSTGIITSYGGLTRASPGFYGRPYFWGVDRRSVTDKYTATLNSIADDGTVFAVSAGITSTALVTTGYFCDYQGRFLFPNTSQTGYALMYDLSDGSAMDWYYTASNSGGSMRGDFIMNDNISSNGEVQVFSVASTNATNPNAVLLPGNRGVLIA